MKRLKMIVASVAVLAIVGSAFAFKAKLGSFCILTTTTAGDNCITYTQNKKITTSTGVGITEYKYYPCWDFNVAACTAVNNHLCTAKIKLQQD